MVADPHRMTDSEWQDELQLVRRGTDFWSRTVDQLADHQLDRPSLLPGWTRRHVIAHVAFNARAMTRLVQWATTGVETPMYSSPQARDQQIDDGAALPAHDLRTLNDEAASTLSAAWRATSPQAWDRTVRTAQGTSIPLRASVWMRTRELWLHTADLDGGAAFADIPVAVLSRVLDDIVGNWKAGGTDPGLRILVTGSAELPELGAGAQQDSALVVRGDLAAVTQWASGRGGHHLDLGAEITSPDWL